MSPSRIQKFARPSANNTDTTTTPTKTPRPMNCFLLYRHEKQKEILAQCPGANHRDISKIIAKWWRQATAEEKEPYVKKAALEKIKHARQYPTYKFMPQKKSKNGTRTYKRRTQDEFTSKSKELNDCMKIMYHGSDADVTASPSFAAEKSIPLNTAENDTPSASVSMPTISVNMVPSSLLLPPMNNPPPYIMNMSSPSSSSLSLSSTSSSPSSLSSPYYHPYAYHDSDIFQQDTIVPSSFLLRSSTPLDCSSPFYSGVQGIDNGNGGAHVPMDASSLFQTSMANLYVPGDYFYQPQQQQQSSLFDTSSSPFPNVYSNYTTYDHHASLYNQDHQQQYLERSLSPSDLYIDPSLDCQDLSLSVTCPSNSLL